MKSLKKIYAESRRYHKNHEVMIASDDKTKTSYVISEERKLRLRRLLLKITFENFKPINGLRAKPCDNTSSFAVEEVRTKLQDCDSDINDNQVKKRENSFLHKPGYLKLPILKSTVKTLHESADEEEEEDIQVLWSSDISPVSDCSVTKKPKENLKHETESTCNGLSNVSSESQTLRHHPLPFPENLHIGNLPTPFLSYKKHGNVNVTSIDFQWDFGSVPADLHRTITCYELYAYKRDSDSDSKLNWTKQGSMESMPLPMGCSVSRRFKLGDIYYFAIRAVDAQGCGGPFSRPCTIHI